MKGRYSIKKSTEGGFDVFFSGFAPMYCATYKTKKKCREHIKAQKKWKNEEAKIRS